MADLKNTQSDKPEADLTEARRLRCNPIIKTVLSEMLEKEILIGDVKYIEARVLEVLNILYKGMAIECFNEIFGTINDSLGLSLDVANKKLWGKDSSKITVADIEKVLKKA